MFSSVTLLDVRVDGFADGIFKEKGILALGADNMCIYVANGNDTISCPTFLGKVCRFKQSVDI